MPKSFQQIIDDTTHEGPPCGPTYARIIFRNWRTSQNVGLPSLWETACVIWFLSAAQSWWCAPTGARVWGHGSHKLVSEACAEKAGTTPPGSIWTLTQITKPLIHTTHGRNCPGAGANAGWRLCVRCSKFAIDQEGLSTQYFNFTQQLRTRNLMGVCAIVEMRW